MGMGSALTSGYNSSREKERSFMPVINTLGQMIAANRKNTRRGTNRIVGGWNSRSDAAADKRDARRKAEDQAAQDYADKQVAEQEVDRQQGVKEDLIAGEEARRQETHDVATDRSRMETAQGEKKFDREEKNQARMEAYEQAKQGLMTKNPELIEAGLKGMMPEIEGEDADVVTYGESESGERSVKARPRAQGVPQFIFHPDGYVGVIFPGQEKPTVFENQEEAFKNVVAPMNPQRWESGGGTARDRVTQEKNTMEAGYKERKLQADVHKDATEFAMKQFEADGYFQPALYNEKEYQASYDNYVQQATGTTPAKRARPDPGADDGPPEQYKGDEAPSGFPGAKRGPKGGWYIQKKGKWYPILEGKTESPAMQEPKKKPSPKKPSSPGRKQMPTAEEGPEVKAAGVPFGRRKDGTPKGPGWLGKLKMKDGSGKDMTELSVGVEFDGREQLIPSIVPTLTKGEIEHLRQGKKPTKAIIDKAVDHAKKRIKEGESPFADDKGISPDARPTSSAQGRSMIPDRSAMEFGGKEGEIYRGRAIPPEHPDAQWDKEEKAWYYFNGETSRWDKVRI